MAPNNNRHDCKSTSNNNNNNDHRRKNRIWTLEDMGQLQATGGPIHATAAAPAATANGDAHRDRNAINATTTTATASSQLLQSTFHIPTLPHADQAQTLLMRVVREFSPIVEQRRYNVRSVSELCCCHQDGLDYRPNRPKGSHKRHKVANNIWGYNQTTHSSSRSQGKSSSSSHTIHLRLRHAGRHDRFLLYEDVAGTMAHELAHCEHGPHNAAFYKLMDDILEQHAVLMASKLTWQGTSLPSFGGAGHILGRGRVLGSASTRSNLQQQLLQRQQQQQQDAGYLLGGDAIFQQWMTPKELAVAAAEARRLQAKLRLRGDHCCQPCVVDSDDDDGDERAPGEGKQSIVGDVSRNKSALQRQPSNESTSRETSSRGFFADKLIVSPSLTAMDRPQHQQQHRSKRQRPLGEKFVIPILGDNENDDDLENIQPSQAKKPVNTASTNQASIAHEETHVASSAPTAFSDRSAYIDLTIDNDDELKILPARDVNVPEHNVACNHTSDANNFHMNSIRAKSSAMGRSNRTTRISASSSSSWSCRRCTLINTNEMALTCVLCQTERRLPTNIDG